jgi:hypothetical protein
MCFGRRCMCLAVRCRCLDFKARKRTEASNVMFLRSVLPRYTEEQKENWAATRTPWNRTCDIKGQSIPKKLGCAESMTPKHLRLACQSSLIGQAKEEIGHFYWPQKGTMVQSLWWLETKLFSHPRPQQLTRIIIIIICKDTKSFMRGIYTYSPESNNVPFVAAVLSLLCMVPISLAAALALCTFTSAHSEVCVQCPIRQFSVVP